MLRQSQSNKIKQGFQSVATRGKYSQESNPGLSNIFICYGYNDKAFVKSLQEAFARNKRDIWIDLKDDPLTEPARDEHISRIRAAEAFIFIISPASIASEECRLQLSHAVEHNKQIIPVLREDVSEADLPSPLADLDLIPFRERDSFDQSFKILLKLIDLDFRLDVFTSYSRTDEAFVSTLDKALEDSGRKTWVDRKAIRHTEEWLTAIYSGIEAADYFVFVISPQSIESENCGKEIAHAINHNKRLVPILRRDVQSKSVRPEIEKLDWIYFREKDDFEVAFSSLVNALDTDLDYVRAHTRWLVKAVEWDKKRRPGSLLLRGTELGEAEDWLANAGDKKPRPASIQSQHIALSRQAASKQQRIITLKDLTGSRLLNRAAVMLLRQ